MTANKAPLAVSLMLFFIFLVGFALSAFVVTDAEIFHWVTPKSTAQKARDQASEGPSSSKGGSAVPEKFVNRARQSVVLVVAQKADGKVCGLGTGFVIKEGYICTAGHVIACGRESEKISIVDYRGKKHQALIEGVSSSMEGPRDLALLKVEPGVGLPPLQLADSASFEAGHDGAMVYTIGYPLPKIASEIDKASISAAGSISQFNAGSGLFIISGLPLNSGNSGGPVFLNESNKVLGIAKAVLRGSVGSGAPVEGVSYVIPIDRMKAFFRDRTGNSL